MSIWQFQRALTVRLLAWGFTSIVSGALFLRMNQFWRGIGSQFLGWGAINALIALGGNAISSNRLRNHPQALEQEFMDNETRNLSRLLWINTILDVFYMAGGLSLALQRKKEGFQRGMGWGILVQGAVLFLFDLIHSYLLPPTRNAWRFWDFSHGEAKNTPRKRTNWG